MTRRIRITIQENTRSVRKNNKRVNPNNWNINRTINEIYLDEVNQINNMPLHPITIAEKTQIRKAFGEILKWAD